MISALLIMLNSIWLLHPFYVSVCQIDYDQETRALQISHRIFYDDLEKALRETYQVKVDVMNPDDPKELSALIGNYLHKNFSVKVNSTEANAKFLGNELEEDAMWCYMEIRDVGIIKSLEIKNTVLFATLNSQINLVHFKYREKIKSLRLRQGKEAGTLVID